MKFTAGERTTPARRVYDVIKETGGASPYEVYRQTQLVASTRDAEWYCRELGRVGLLTAQGSRWSALECGNSELTERLRDVRPPIHRGQSRDQESTAEDSISG